MIITFIPLYVIIIFQYLIVFLGKILKEIKTIYIIIQMVETEINNFINKKCYDCCHLKKKIWNYIN